MRPITFTTALALAGLTAFALPLAPARGDDKPGLSLDAFEKCHKDLQPPTEAWQLLPWKLSILEARAQAAKEKKPVYMLVRSGHPLGCV
jgi:hypothetical protein